jgi:hypothetical protein
VTIQYPLGSVHCNLIAGEKRWLEADCICLGIYEPSLPFNFSLSEVIQMDSLFLWTIYLLWSITVVTCFSLNFAFSFFFPHLCLRIACVKRQERRFNAQLCRPGHEPKVG